MQLEEKNKKSFLDQVPGNFHVSTHSSRQQPENPDMTHFVHKVAFGHDVKVMDALISAPSDVFWTK